MKKPFLPKHVKSSSSVGIRVLNCEPTDFKCVFVVSFSDTNISYNPDHLGTRKANRHVS